MSGLPIVILALVFLVVLIIGAIGLAVSAQRGKGIPFGETQWGRALSALFGARAAQPAGDALPYERRSHLFSAAERSFLGVLDDAVGASYRVFGKVRVADLLRVTRGLERGKWQQAFNRISAKHVDFVVCRRTDLAVMLWIELDDNSHSRSDRMTRDDFLEEAARAANVPLLRVQAEQLYTAQRVAEAVAPYLP